MIDHLGKGASSTQARQHSEVAAGLLPGLEGEISDLRAKKVTEFPG